MQIIVQEMHTQRERATYACMTEQRAGEKSEKVGNAKGDMVLLKATWRSWDERLVHGVVVLAEVPARNLGFIFLEFCQ